MVSVQGYEQVRHIENDHYAQFWKRANRYAAFCRDRKNGLWMEVVDKNGKNLAWINPWGSFLRLIKILFLDKIKIFEPWIPEDILNEVNELAVGNSMLFQYRFIANEKPDYTLLFPKNVFRKWDELVINWFSYTLLSITPL